MGQLGKNQRNYALGIGLVSLYRLNDMPISSNMTVLAENQIKHQANGIRELGRVVMHEFLRSISISYEVVCDLVRDAI